MRQRIVIADEGGTSLNGPQPLNRDCWVHVRQVNRACLEGSNLVSPNGIGFLPPPQAPIERGFLRTSKCPLPDSVCFDFLLSARVELAFPHASIRPCRDLLKFAEFAALSK